MNIYVLSKTATDHFRQYTVKYRKLPLPFFQKIRGLVGVPINLFLRKCCTLFQSVLFASV